MRAIAGSTARDMPWTMHQRGGEPSWRGWVQVLREEIEEMKAADPSAKCLVFSQFTSFLDIIEHRLVSTGIKVVRLTGSMSLPQR